MYQRLKRKLKRAHETDDLLIWKHAYLETQLSKLTDEVLDLEMYSMIEQVTS